MRRRQLLLGALCLPAHANEPTRVPLVAGLTVATALHEPGVGDYESVKTLGTRITQPAPGWRIDYRASLPQGAERVQSTRHQSDADLANATTYRSRFESDTEEHYPGSTALGVSTAVLRALRKPGGTPFTLVEAPEWLRQPADAGALELARSLTVGEVMLRGELRAATPATGSQSVLVNGRPVDLPVRWAEGTLSARSGKPTAVRLALLDDDVNPLALAWRIGGAQLTVVRLDWPRPDADTALAAELQRAGRVALPGLYFDFGQATLQSRSEAALSACVRGGALARGGAHGRDRQRASQPRAFARAGAGGAASTCQSRAVSGGPAAGRRPGRVSACGRQHHRRRPCAQSPRGAGKSLKITPPWPGAANHSKNDSNNHKNYGG